MEVDTVLVPVDGSEDAMAAVEYAVAIARRYDAVVHALYVLGEDAATAIREGELEAAAIATRRPSSSGPPSTSSPTPHSPSSRSDGAHGGAARGSGTPGRSAAARRAARRGAVQRAGVGSSWLGPNRGPRLARSSRRSPTASL